MARLPRYVLVGTHHHITARATGGGTLFVDDDDRVYFLALLRRSIRQFKWTPHAHCLMGTHYHLIVEAPLEQLSRGMHRLNGRYATEFNARHRRSGRLFADRFASWVIRDEAHYYAACDYVLQNPVRAGLCKRAAEWRWSGLGMPR
jgi:REP element-mobilizing transposase RayT